MANNLTITGNLAANPERTEFGKEKENGQRGVFTKFRVGNNEWVNGKSVANGFFDVVVFNDQANHIFNSLKKGDRVIVTGYLQHQVYDKPDGTKGATTKFIAEEIGASLRFQPMDFERKARTIRDDGNVAGLIAELDSKNRAADNAAEEALLAAAALIEEVAPAAV